MCFWKDARATWDMLQFGARLGDRVRGVITTTPIPIKLLKEIQDRETTRLTTGSTYDNADNLAPTYLQQIRETYEGTRIGRQEVYGEILDDNPNALWSRKLIENARVVKTPQLKRIVVAVDPSATGTGDECGIVVVGKEGNDFYVLDDVSRQASPTDWAKAVVTAHHKHSADRIIYESNMGGEMVEATIRTIDKNVPVRPVRATRGKHLRAEPIAALYEQGKVHHVGNFDALENEMCEWTPDSADSPNRLDALVWALTELSGRGTPDMLDRSAVGA